MDLIALLDNEILSDICCEFEELFLRKEAAGKSTSRHIKAMDSIGLVDFCSVISKYIHRGCSMSISDYTILLRLLCHIFDAVDVDSRGFISWFDFTSFCLRMGRIYLSPSFSGTNSGYHQVSVTNVNPCQRLFFAEGNQTLYAIDKESPVFRSFHRNGDVNRKFNAIDALDGYMSRDFSVAHGENKGFAVEDKKYVSDNGRKRMILCGCYCHRANQIVVSTSDNYLIFFSVGSLRKIIIGYAKAAVPQIGLYNSKEAHVLLSWAANEGGHKFSIWDPQFRTLISQVQIHHSPVMAVCELGLQLTRHAGSQRTGATSASTNSVASKLKSSRSGKIYVASCSQDRKLLIWPISTVMEDAKAAKERADLTGASFANNSSSKMTSSSSYQSSHQPGSSFRSEGGRSFLRSHEEDTFELRGHVHGLRSLIYAVEHELLLGAGFDFEAYAWDPWTGVLKMKFVGHIYPVIGIQLAYIPLERAITMDENGNVKVWNLGTDDSRAEKLHSMLVSVQGNTTAVRMLEFVTTLVHGYSLSVLASNFRVYNYVLDGDSTEDFKPVTGGIISCERTGRLLVSTRKAICLTKLNDGGIIKRLGLMDTDRYDISRILLSQLYKKNTEKMQEEAGNLTTAHGQKMITKGSMEETMKKVNDLHTVVNKVASQLQVKTDSDSVNVVRDYVTCVTSDALGKKLFLGTADGHILLFDTASCGLLVHINATDSQAVETQEQDRRAKHRDSRHQFDDGEMNPKTFSKSETPTREAPVADSEATEQGSVIMLKYCERDEIVLAAFSSGAIRAYIGCHRSSPAFSEANMQRNHASQDTEREEFPGGGGGNVSVERYLIRGCNLDLGTDSIASFAFSQVFNVVVVAVKSGQLRVFDYFHFVLQNVFSVPPIAGGHVDNTDVCCLSMLPAYAVSDTSGRVTIFAHKPHEPQRIVTFCPFDMSVLEPTAFLQSVAAESAPRIGHRIGPSLMNIVSTTFRKSAADVVSGKRRSSRKLSIDGENDSRSGPRRSRRGRLSARASRSRRSLSKSFDSSDGEAEEPSVVHPFQSVEWAVLVGDEKGNVMKVDITYALEKSKLLLAAHPSQEDNRYLAYNVVFYNTALGGLPSAIARDIMKELDEPIGMAPNKLAGAPTEGSIGTSIQGSLVTRADVRLAARWRAHDLGVTNLQLVNETRHLFRVGIHTVKKPHQLKSALMQCPKLPPAMIMTASEMGIVKAWSWGGKLLGEMNEHPEGYQPSDVEIQNANRPHTSHDSQEGNTRSFKDSFCNAVTRQNSGFSKAASLKTIRASRRNSESMKRPSVVKGLPVSMTKEHNHEMLAVLLRGQDSDVGFPEKVIHEGWVLPPTGLLSKAPPDLTMDNIRPFSSGHGDIRHMSSTQSEHSGKASEFDLLNIHTVDYRGVDYFDAMVFWTLKGILPFVSPSQMKATKRITFPINTMMPIMETGYVEEKSTSAKKSPKATKKISRPYDDSLMKEELFAHSRDFGESCSHAPLDFSTSKVLDYSALFEHAGENMLAPLIEPLQSSKKEYERMRRIQTRFSQAWGVKVRFEHLDKELGEHAFPSITDPALALGKQPEAHGKKKTRPTGLDRMEAVLTAEIKAHEMVPEPRVSPAPSLKSKSWSAKRVELRNKMLDKAHQPFAFFEAGDLEMPPKPDTGNRIRENRHRESVSAERKSIIQPQVRGLELDSNNNPPQRRSSSPSRQAQTTPKVGRFDEEPGSETPRADLILRENRFRTPASPAMKPGSYWHPNRSKNRPASASAASPSAASPSAASVSIESAPGAVASTLSPRRSLDKNARESMTPVQLTRRRSSIVRLERNTTSEKFLRHMDGCAYDTGSLAPAVSPDAVSLDGDVNAVRRFTEKGKNYKVPLRSAKKKTEKVSAEEKLDVNRVHDEHAAELHGRILSPGRLLAFEEKEKHRIEMEEKIRNVVAKKMQKTFSLYGEVSGDDVGSPKGYRRLLSPRKSISQLQAELEDAVPALAVLTARSEQRHRGKEDVLTLDEPKYKKLDENAMRTRYGPYHIRDIMWFTQYYTGLVQESNRKEQEVIQYGSKVKEGTAKNIFDKLHDDGPEHVHVQNNQDNRLHLFYKDEVTIPQQHALNRLLKFPDLRVKLEYLASKTKSSLTRDDLASLFFPYATFEEKTRILILSKVVETVMSVAEIAKPPHSQTHQPRRVSIGATTYMQRSPPPSNLYLQLRGASPDSRSQARSPDISRPDTRRQSATSEVHSIHGAPVSPPTPTHETNERAAKKQELRNKISASKRVDFAQTLPAAQYRNLPKLLHPTQHRGIAKWLIPHDVLVECEHCFDTWYAQVHGTITVQEIVDIIQCLCSFEDLVECPPILYLSAALGKEGIQSNAEVDGKLFHRIMTDGLKMLVGADLIHSSHHLIIPIS